MNDVAQQARGIRYREMGRIHAGRAAKAIMPLTGLCLSAAEQEAIALEIARLLETVYTGATDLEPNDMQMAAAAAGKTEISDADMLMFAARLKVLGSVSYRQGKAIAQQVGGAPLLAGEAEKKQITGE